MVGSQSGDWALNEFTQRFNQLPHLLKDSCQPTKLLEGTRWHQRSQSGRSGFSSEDRLPSGTDSQPSQPSRSSSSSSSDRGEQEPGIVSLGTFGTLRLERRLGQGGHAKVYAGKDVDTSKEYAVKITQLHKKYLLDRFTREVEIMKLLSHRSIVQPLATHIDGQWAAMVMDLAQGGDLLRAVASNENGRLKEIEARHIFSQLLDGMDHMHCQHIIHRDLKLENILIHTQQDLNSCTR